MNFLQITDSRVTILKREVIGRLSKKLILASDEPAGTQQVHSLHTTVQEGVAAAFHHASVLLSQKTPHGGKVSLKVQLFAPLLPLLQPLKSPWPENSNPPP